MTNTRLFAAVGVAAIVAGVLSWQYGQSRRQGPVAPEPAPAVASADPADQSAQPAKFTDAERREHVAEVFDAERTDPSWHGEADARSLFRQVLPAGSALRSVACRKSLCRVETSHPDAEARRAYVNALAMPNPGREMPFAGMLFDAEDDQAENGQTLRSVTYLVRTGYDLPNPR